ncbi:MAG TPA: peptidylprolyl isomerase, partial [Steroidobacteraceae bacterium]|nr:peptidylprolyl isomerase [Steroidobacteraceae bacterium]
GVFLAHLVFADARNVMPIRRLLRDPLLHFLAVGGLLFAAYYALAGNSRAAADDRTIEVDRSGLLAFLQYQSAAFQPQYFNAQFDAMPRAAKQELIDKYVQEEALYREAQAMGLSQGDYVIRRRVVQKILYLLDDAASESFAPTQAQLQAYYLAHRERYEVIPALTFTQVFVDEAIRRPKSAAAIAEDLKRQLTVNKAGFNDAPAYGDRFPYQQNYVGRDTDFIKAQFGPQFEESIVKLEPSVHTWYGPLRSQFGYHLVLVTAHTPAHLPALADITVQVRDDLLRDALQSQRDKAVADLVARFKVKLKDITP